MNNATNNRSTSVPAGAPIGGSAARRAAFQSAGQLGRRFAAVSAPAPSTAAYATAAPANPVVPSGELMTQRVIATYSMFRAA